MSSPKQNRPPFQSIELETIDARLDKQAQEKGIPTLVTPQPKNKSIRKPAVAVTESEPAAEATPRARMRALTIELPDYVWIELKTRAARKMISVRHLIMRMMQEAGITIEEGDMIEDGRRLRGKNSPMERR